MQSKFATVLFLAVTNAFVLTAIEKSLSSSDSSHFIYGRVTTLDNEVYEGQIRWGKEEAFWFDFFNGTKKENDNLKWLTREELEDLNKKDAYASNDSWGKWFNKRSNYKSDHNHLFACQFGDIKTIKIRRGEKVDVEFKNGEIYELDGGSNDIGTQVQVNDEELGVVRLDWDRIDHVDFVPTPRNFKSKFGEPLYGKVKTTYGEFEGFLQWDHDERLSLDELNGSTEDGEVDIEFGKIKSIEKSYRGSDVTLMSGRTLHLTGSNDVNSDNRGIIVNMPNYGRVDIAWDEFESMSFNEVPNNLSIAYNDYKGEKHLKGNVESIDGTTYSGEIIFDLDEKYALEMLDGNIDDVEYFIPFSAVRSIAPKNRSESLVTLTNGENFLFEDKVDVTEANDGVLVKVNDEYTYVSWSKIEKITFE